MMTLEKLAEVTGVSRATLDRVIHNRPNVKEKTRVRVLRAIEEAGYTPNSVGKALAMQKKLKFGIVISADLMPEDNTLFSFILEGMQLGIKRLEGAGVNFIIKRLTVGSADEQVEAINQLLELGVTGIAISPEEADEKINNAVAHAQEKGVFVVCYYNGAREENFDYFVGSDSLREGRIAAELLQKFMGRVGEVALFSGLVKNSVHQMRILGAGQKIAEDYPEINVVERITGNYTENIAYNNCIEVLERHPHLDGVIASCGGITGIMNALEEKNVRDKVKVIFFDFTPKAQHFLKEGSIDALIGVELTAMGYTTVKLMYERVMQGNINPMEISVPMLIKLKECL